MQRVLRPTTALLALLLLVLTGCGASSTPTPAPAPASAPAPAAAPAPVKVRWGTILNASQSYIPIVIRDRGLDKKYGLQLEINALSNTGQQWSGLRSGDFDVTSGSVLDLLRQRKAGLKAKAFAGFMGMSNPIVAPANKPYKGIADLKGARVGTPSRTLFAWMIYRATGLKSDGVDIDKIAGQVTESAPALMLQLMNKGDLDASVEFSSLLYEPLSKGKLKQVLDLPDVLSKAGFDSDSFYLLWMVSETWAEKNPDALPRLAAAIADANDILQTDDSVWPALAKSSGVEDQSLVPLFMKMTRNELKTNYSQAKLEPTQKLMTAIAGVVGEEALGASTVDPAAFDFIAVEKAMSIRTK